MRSRGPLSIAAATLARRAWRQSPHAWLYDDVVKLAEDAVHPQGKVEVVLQHLASRTPFDDLAMREELRRRLDEADGIDLPASKIRMRPSLPSISWPTPGRGRWSTTPSAA